MALAVKSPVFRPLVERLLGRGLGNLLLFTLEKVLTVSLQYGLRELPTRHSVVC